MITSTQPQPLNLENIVSEEIDFSVNNNLYQLSDELGKVCFDEFQSILKKDYRLTLNVEEDLVDMGLIPTLNILQIIESRNQFGTVMGSNPFVLSILNPILEKYDYSPADIKTLFKSMRKGHYLTGNTDLGLVLRDGPVSRENAPTRENLLSQITERYPKVKLPVLIPISGLRLVSYPGSSYNNLSFEIINGTNLISSDVLNKTGYFSLDDIDNKTGLPKKIKELEKNEEIDKITGMPKRFIKDIRAGHLKIASSNQGLSRAYINHFPGLNLDYNDLGISYAGSRIYLMKR